MRYAVSAPLGEKLERFVKNGGTLLFTYISAMVNENDLCYLGGFPGAGLRKVFGIWNEEIDTLYPEDSNTVRMNDGKEYRAADYCELIHTEGAEVLARYTEDFYAGMPALTANGYGNGKAYYQAFRDDGAFADMLVSRLLKGCGISGAFDGELPEGVTAHSRTDGENTYVFVQNFSDNEKKIETKSEWVNTETKEKTTENIVVKPLQTLIIMQ